MERPPVGEMNPLEKRKKELRERFDAGKLHDLVVGVRALPMEIIDAPQLVVAMRCIVERMLENTFVGQEEKVADEILQMMKAEALKRGQGEQKEKPELWLMSPTGQLVLTFLRVLVHEKPEELYGAPVEKEEEMSEDIPEALRVQVQAARAARPAKTKADQMVEFAEAFFEQDNQTWCNTIEMARLIFLEIQEKKEFILPTPYPPITQIPRSDVLCDQSKGHRFREVSNQYFLEDDPNNDGRPRADFAVTAEDYPLYGLQTPEEQKRFVLDIEAANSERFPVCALFNITKAVEAFRRDSLNIETVSRDSLPMVVLLAAVEAEGYVFSTVDTALPYAQYAWDEEEHRAVFSLGSPFTGHEGHRCVHFLYPGGERRSLDTDRLDEDEWYRFVPYLVLRRAPDKNLATEKLGA